MNGHTPGPWVYADSGCGTARVTTVAHCCEFVIGLASDIPGGNYRNGDPSGDAEADARLIAAAPELLAALMLARAEFAGLPHSLGYEFTHLPKIDAAIAKATQP